jgi:hypothetical protein
LNHFTVPCSLLTAVLVSVSRVTAEHCFFKLSDASSPEPLYRASAVFKPCFARPQSRSAKQKKGRKFDLATALQPKGDTRATNAKLEYHKEVLSANGFYEDLSNVFPSSAQNHYSLVFRRLPGVFPVLQRRRRRTVFNRGHLCVPLASTQRLRKALTTA